MLLGGDMLKKDKKSPSVGDTTTISTLLGKDTQIEGTLHFRETIRVDGHIKGKLISTDGTAIIGETAVLDADVQVGVAIIRGKINGRIEAAHRVELYAPAQVSGDIAAPSVAIDSGVKFNGNCKMERQNTKDLKVVKNEPKPAPETDAQDQKK